MEIPAGAIPPKVPRPLTDEEARVVSDRKAEALAASGKLEALKARHQDRKDVAKRERQEAQRKTTARAIKKPTSNLVYTKDDEEEYSQYEDQVSLDIERALKP